VKELLTYNLKYIIFGLIFATVITLIVSLIYRVVSKKSFFTRERVWKNVFVYYVLFILYIALFSREVGSVDVVSMIPFASWRPFAYHPYFTLFFIENIIVSIPLGILIVKIKNSIPLAIVSGFALSLFIELMQFILKCGYVQFDDVMTNVAGTIIGAYIMMRIIHSKERKVDE